MGVSGETVFHPSDLSEFSGWVIERRTVQVFNLNTCLVGVEMDATYHSVIATVKLHGCSIWNFIGLIFKNILVGAGIMLTWFLTKSLRLPTNVNFNTN